MWNPFGPILERLDRIERKLDRIRGTQHLELEMARNERELTEELVGRVAGLTDVALAVETTLDGLRQQIADAAGSDVSPQLQQALDSIDAFKGRIAAAVVKGTPADPAPSDPLPEPEPPAQPAG